MSLILDDPNKKWSKFWESGFTPWVSDKPNELLWDHIHLLHNKDVKPEDAGLFLVPFCGKVMDMKLLYQMGFKVVGVEYHEPAVQAFFKEQNLEFVTRNEPRVEGGFIEYSTPDGCLRILVTDFMKVTPELLGCPVKMVWDRGAMGAVEKHLRKPYVQTMTSLLDPDFRYLLDCLDYKDWYADAAPRSVPLELLHELFLHKVHIKILKTSRESFPWVSPDPVTRFVYLITGKRAEY